MAADFVTGLARLVSVATLYAADHRRVADVVHDMLAVRAAIEHPAGPFLVLDIGDPGLAVQGIPVAAETQGADRVRELAESLGIIRIEFGPDAGVTDLHTLALVMRRRSAELSARHSLVHADFSGLPDSIRIHVREFGRARGGVERRAVEGAALEEVVEAVLTGLGLEDADGEARGAYEDFVRGTLTGAVERVQQGGAQGTGPGRAHDSRSLEEVLKIGMEAIRHALGLALGADGGPGGLSELSSIVEQAISLSDDADSARLMVDVLREAGGAEPDRQEGEEAGSHPVEYEMSMEDLQAALREIASEAVPLGDLRPGDSTEHVSILCGLLLDPERGTSESERVEAGLRSIVQLGGPAEVRVLQDALADLIGNQDPETRPKDLENLLAALGGGSPSSTTVALLSSVSRELPAHRVRFLWPRLVDGLLGGATLRPAVFDGVVAQIARLPASNLPECVDRLRGMRAVREGRISKAVFQPLRSALFPLFDALLLSRDRATLVPWILQGLLTGSSHFLPGCVLEELEGKMGFNLVLLEILRSEKKGAPTPGMRKRVGTAILERLGELERGERTADWVAPAIASIGDLSFEPGRGMLQTMCRKRYLLFPAWPSSCRKAAARALHQLDGEHHR